MSSGAIVVPEPEPAITEEQTKEIIEKFEGATRSVKGPVGIVITAIVDITALTLGIGGWLLRKAGWFERLILVVAGLILIYPSMGLVIIGLTLFAAVLFFSILRRDNLSP